MSRFGTVLLVMVCLLAYAGCSDEKANEGAGAPPATATPDTQIVYAAGFFDLERAPSGSWRWMEPVGTVRLKNTGKDMRLKVVGNVPADRFPQPPNIKIEFNGEKLDEFSGLTVDKEYVIPAAKHGGKDYSELRITSNKFFVPKEVDKNATDPRHLAFSLTQLIWTPK